MGKRVRITNDSVNSYGSRVLTDGMDVEQYMRNPVLLYMHERGKVIGYVKDLKKENGELTGELVFDEVTELSQRCKKQWEFGSLKMVSAGLDVLEMSEEKEYVVVGQTRPTVTKSKLYEVSLVDIGANDDAIVLRKDGVKITMGMDGVCLLPLLSNNQQNNEREMELKKISLAVGLDETSTEEEVVARLEAMKQFEQEALQLRSEKEALELERMEALVDGAIGDKKFGMEQKEHFIGLGKKIGFADLKATLDAMQPHVRLTQLVSTAGFVGGTNDGYKSLHDVPSDKLMELREKEPEEYRRLYKAEYGIEFDSSC